MQGKASRAWVEKLQCDGRGGWEIIGKVGKGSEGWLEK